MRRGCAHCGLPVRLAHDAPAPVFCCFGCSLAYEVWGGEGLPSGSLAGGILARLMLGVFFAMAAMVFSVALYAGALFPLAPGSRHALGPLADPFRWLALAFATPVLLLLGGPLLTHNLARFERTPGLWPVNVLILVGVGAAYTFSLINAWRGSGEIYVETVVMVLVLVTLGRFLDAQARYRATSSVRGLLALDPEIAWRVPEATSVGPLEETTPPEVVLGDFVFVRAGDSVPVDGTVVRGNGELDESLITGESGPLPRSPGDGLYAGSRLLQGCVTLRCTQPVGTRLLDRLAELADSSRERRMPLELLSEKVSRWFLPLSVLVALATTLYWWPRANAEEALLHGLAVLLVSCPCALGIASPLATWVAVGNAARRGVLVYGGEQLERLARGGKAFLDKTGTLTSSRLEVCDVVFIPGRTPSEVVRYAAALAALSSHPVSDAIRRYAQAQTTGSSEVANFAATASHGLEGRVGNAHVHLGTARFVPDQGASVLPHIASDSDDGRVFVAVDGRSLGCLFVREELRPEAHEAIAALAGLNYSVEVLTGDTKEKGEALALRLAVPVHAALGPEEKLRHIETTHVAGQTSLAVGDGLNDAPVLAAADVAVAMGSGTQTARDAAGIVLLETSPTPLLGLPYLVILARRTVRRIRFNLFWAFGYNVLGMGFAAAGLLHPVLAVILMISSSLFVVVSSVGLEALFDPAPSCRET